ncbi:MAG: YndJ family protein [bacterium]
MNFPLSKSSQATLYGFLIWLILLWLFFAHRAPLTSIDLLFLLSPLMIAPVVMRLKAIFFPPRSKAQSLTFSLATHLQPFLATAVAISFLKPQGIRSGAFASSWLLFTGLLSLHALFRIFENAPERYRNRKELSVNVAFLYVSIGAAWLAVYRLGIYPLEFGPTITLLTAVHFHYAGFAAPFLAGLLGTRIPDSPQGAFRFYGPIVFMILLGVPLIAAGITFSPLVETFGACVMAGGVAGLGLLTLRSLKLFHNPRTRICLFLSSLSALSGMALAVLYGIRALTHGPMVSLPQMVKFHGWINSVGFVGLGLLGWSLENRHSSGK